VSKRYGAVQALANANVEIAPGEVLSLLGANGAGKSTLVKILAGLVKLDSGTIELDGEQVSFSGSDAAQAQGISVVNQEFSLVPSMSIAENLAIGQVSYGRIWGPRKLRARAREALEAVGLVDLDPDTIVEQLGVAERQLVEVARVVARDSRLVIFDEPTAALAAGEIARVQDIVRRVVDRGCSVIYVTHRLSEVFQISDSIQVVRNGETLDPVKVADVDVQRIITMMLGRDLGQMYPPKGSRTDQEVVVRIDELRAPGLESPVTLDVHAGEILGLTGQIGSGASTVVRALAGTAPWTEGTVALRGEPLPLNGRKPGIEKGVAYCSADRKRDGIFAELPVIDNLSSAWLRMVSSMGMVSGAAEHERAEAAARGFAIDPKRLGSLVGTLSGGNQQKVALGKWLGIEPIVFLADEPTRGVDVGARAEIYGRLREMADRGAAVIISSSDSGEVLGLCDVVATFYDGSMSRVKPVAEWTEHEVLRDVMHRDESSDADLERQLQRSS